MKVCFRVISELTGNDLTDKECCYCDWSYKCRKGHPCTWYKKFVKKVVSNKGAKKNKC